MSRLGKKETHFTYVKRQQLEMILKIKGHCKHEIGLLLEKIKRSINREILKGRVELLNSDLSVRIEYRADKAHRRAMNLASHKGKNIKLGKDFKLASHIENRIKKDKYSPEAVIGEIKVKGLKFDTTICVKILYNYIDNEIFMGISNKDLPVKKNKKKRKYRRLRMSYKNLTGTSIEQRAPHIDSREELGHWEWIVLLELEVKEEQFYWY